jgi:hypothetical protein
MNFCKMLHSELTKIDRDILFDDIIGYDHIKRLFRMALDSNSAVHLLLVGPPASAMMIFLKSLMLQVKNSYVREGGNSTKAGMTDYSFTNKPRYPLSNKPRYVYTMKDGWADIDLLTNPLDIQVVERSPLYHCVKLGYV